MTSYVFNDTRTVASGAQMFALSGSDAIVLGSQAFWVAQDIATVGLRLSSNNRVRISGELYTAGTAIVGGIVGHRIDITADGVVASSSSNGIELGSGNSIVNDGYISGVDAIIFSGTGNIVNNAGTITGYDDAILFGPGFGDDRVINTGTIAAVEGDAIGSTGSDSFFLVNEGTIEAYRGTGLDARDVLFAAIVNSGVMAGLTAIRLGAGADSVMNSGVIIGTVELGSGDDVFDSTGGQTTSVISGGGGDDLLVGGTGGNRLNGDSGFDRLEGNAGDDILNGGSDGDELSGGDGLDIASYLSLDFAVVADLQFSDRNTGNAAGDSYVSIEGLTGSDRDDQLYGDANRNHLRGGNGDDLLDGRAGSDVMRGGANDDRYVVSDAEDRIIELADAGYDSVTARVNFVLPDFVEALTLIGPDAIDGTGNALNNVVIGNGAANMIDGGSGNDVLTGGGGADVFRFATALGNSNQDIVEDFVSGTDHIALSRAIFTEIGGGSALAAGRFVVGSAGAQDANDRIIYDPANGGLYYDPDGSGRASQILFAALDPGLIPGASDFVLVG